MPNPKKFCIYCGGAGLSKEHIWPDWLEPYIPRTKMSWDSRVSMFVKPNEKAESTLSFRQGDPHVTKLRVVCKTCNRGWMSKLQTEAKPILVPMLTGKCLTLFRSQQKILARWAAMSFMTAEFRTPPLVAVPQEEREYLRLRSRVPSTWRIWLGSYRRDAWKGHLIHHTFPVVSKELIPEIMENGLPRPNTQSSTFVVGEIFFTAISSPFTRTIGRWRFSDHNNELLAPLWPTQKTIIWPLPRMGDADADAISAEFFRASTRHHVKS